MDQKAAKVVRGCIASTRNCDVDSQDVSQFLEEFRHTFGNSGRAMHGWWHRANNDHRVHGETGSLSIWCTPNRKPVGADPHKAQESGAQ